MAARARRLSLTRRGLFGVSGAAALVAGCGTVESRSPSRKDARRAGRFRYGEDRSQFADLRMPEGTPLATVVLLHGGYWQAAYGLAQMDPLADRLNELGFATWNVEYRRVDLGGGFPNTLEDVAVAMDRLREGDLPEGITDNVITLGHSAGGHLAVWAASRSSLTPGGEPRVGPRAAISLAGVLDLTRAGTDPQAERPVGAFMGGDPAAYPERYAVADPSRLVPASCPVWALHAENDTVVPGVQSLSYVTKARAAGAKAERLVVPGDHFTVNDPGSDSAPVLERLLVRVAARPKA